MKNAPNSDDREHRRDVEAADRLGEVLADALDVEDGLGEDRAAAEDVAEVQAPQRDDRDERVAQHVAEQHARSPRPLARAVRT